MANEDNIASLIAEQQASRDALDDYVHENRAAGLNAEVMREHNDRIERADRAAYTARRASAERLNSMSPAEYEVEKRRFLDDQEYEAYLRREKL